MQHATGSFLHSHTPASKTDRLILIKPLGLPSSMASQPPNRIGTQAAGARGPINARALVSPGFEPNLVDFHFVNSSARSELAEVLSWFALLLCTALSFSYPLIFLFSLPV